MITYTIPVALGIVVDAWLLAFVLLRSGRTWIKAVFTSLAAAFIVMGAAYVGTTEGILAPAWEAVTLWSLVLAHPLVAIFVLGLIHGESLPRRRPAAFLLLAPVPLLAAVAPAGGWSLREAYEANPLGGFLVLNLSIALAEAIYVRMTSPLLRTEAFWLSAGVIALVIAGPIYAYELQALGLPDPGGSNLATPVALGTFALVTSHMNPFPAAFRGHRRRWSGETSVESGLVFVFDETRPKYLEIAARREAARGRPVLITERASGNGPEVVEGPLRAAIGPTRHGALRTLGTASEFLAREPGGIVAVPDLAAVFALSGPSRTLDLIRRLRRMCRESGSTLLLSTARLRSSEREALRGLRLPWWSLPEPVKEMESILARGFGSGAGRILEAFGRDQSLSRADITTDHIPALCSFLARAVRELATGAKDPKVADGLRTQVVAVTDDLEAYGARTPVDLSNGGWPSRAESRPEGDFLVTAADYWKGKEAEELFAAAQEIVAREPLHERARAIFVEHLGEAGETMFRSELAKLGKRPEDLRAADVTRLADRAAVDLSVMADVIDIPKEQERLRGQIESIRRRLTAIQGDDS